jgi:pSer/pThr/pTyr-binding forkhead associated (FHA) protein
MSVFGLIEKGLQAAVDWVFRRGGVVEIPEITQRLEKELDREAQLLSRDRWVVPNDFHVQLSKADYARLFPLSRTMNEEITKELREYATERSYSFPGPITIAYEERPEIPTGRFKLTSRSLAGVTDPAAGRATPGQPAQPGELVLEVNGIRHPLVPGSFVIGRGHEANVTISDPGMSRNHAEIVVNATDEGRTIHIVDLESRNGVYVNDQRVPEAELHEGDHITLGSTQLLVRAPAGR